jgi:hypothetical protein
LRLLFAQQRPDVGGVAVGRLFQRCLHVDLQQEMDAAAQVQAQVHREGSDRRQPMRRRREQVERNDVILAEAGLQHIAGTNLCVGIGEPDLDAGLIQRRPPVGDLPGLQSAFDLDEQRVVELDGGLRCTYLHRGRFREEVRQRVQEADQQRGANEQVFPERVAVHGAVRLLESGGSDGGTGCAERPVELAVRKA